MNKNMETSLTFLSRYEEWGFSQNLDLTYDIKKRTCIRVNTNIISPKKLLHRFEDRKVRYEKIPFLKNGYYVTAMFPLPSMIEYLLGYFYIQEAPAQIIGDIFEKEIASKKFDDLRVLDMCAAPGGKTTHFAQALRNKGNILAIDSMQKRANALCYSLERMRSKNVDVLCKDALLFDFSKIVKKAETNFDIILVDAPCSGNFTQSEDWFDKRSLEDFKNRNRLQKQLVERAISLLKKDGLLFYATCSLEKEENEDIVSFILEHYPHIKLQDISSIYNDYLENCFGLTKEAKGALRLWPTQHQQPGFFIALFKKK